MTFNEILKDKMSSSKGLPPRETPIAQGLDPAHLAYLMGQMARTTAIPPRGKYPQKPASPLRKAHILSDLQRAALEFMRDFAPSLDDRMTAHELKRAFRLGALHTHPDRGGSADLYAALRTHYATLSSIFATN